MMRFVNRRILSILGAVIVFTTFVLKDAWREHLKDLKETLGTAETFYELREENHELAVKIENLSQNVESVRDDSKNLIEILTNKSRNLNVVADNPMTLTLCEKDMQDIDRVLQLVRRMPDHEKIERTLSAYRSQLYQIHQSAKEFLYQNLYAKDLQGIDAKWFGEASRIGYESHAEIRRIVAMAETFEERDEHQYEMATYASYFFYALGWGLTLAGRVFGVEGLAAAEE